jgi:hypothetical protein
MSLCGSRTVESDEASDLTYVAGMIYSFHLLWNPERNMPRNLEIPESHNLRRTDPLLWPADVDADLLTDNIQILRNRDYEENGASPV